MREPANREPSELNVISKAKDLVKHSFLITNGTNRYPKKMRFTLVNRIQDRAMNIYECLLEANELNIKDPQQKPERLSLQAKAITYCKELLFLVELSFDMQYLSAKSCEHWTKKILDVKYMTSAWLKKDRQR
jgi:hypothetical protein